MPDLMQMIISYANIRITRSSPDPRQYELRTFHPSLVKATISRRAPPQFPLDDIQALPGSWVVTH
jgi:hypothetical protein